MQQNDLQVDFRWIPALGLLSGSGGFAYANWVWSSSNILRSKVAISWFFAIYSTRFIGPLEWQTKNHATINLLELI